MKKKIEIEIPSRIGIEGETKRIREQAAQRRLESITRAIAVRTKTAIPPKDKFVINELLSEKIDTGKGEGFADHNKARKILSVEITLTQKQIDALPVGLRKMLK